MKESDFKCYLSNIVFYKWFRICFVVENEDSTFWICTFQWFWKEWNLSRHETAFQTCFSEVLDFLHLTLNIIPTCSTYTIKHTYNWYSIKYSLSDESKITRSVYTMIEWESNLLGHSIYHDLASVRCLHLSLSLDQKMTQVLDFQAYQAQPIVSAVTLVILQEND